VYVGAYVGTNVGANVGAYVGTYVLDTEYIFCDCGFIWI
jgi:hypothetical protein